MSGLTLYNLSTELTDMITLRMEMIEAREDVTDINVQIAEYLKALPQKVDSVAHVIRHMEAQEQLAVKEVARINARKKQIEAERGRLEDYVKFVLGELPPPARGKIKRLSGSTSAFELWPNGGLAPLEIQDEAMVPDEYCLAIVTMPMPDWKAFRGSFEGSADVDRKINDSAIRAALAAGEGVPGCSLRERGSHLRIR